MLSCRRFLERAAEGKAERLDKHRFLVQSKTIEDEDFEKVSAISAAERSEEVRQNSNMIT